MKFDRNVKFVCSICGKETTFYRWCDFYRCHLKVYHGDITEKQYYDKFYKKENEGKCLACGKETKFVGFLVGYRPYCSCKCTKATEESRKKLSDIKKKLFSNEESKRAVIEKTQKTNLLKYGTKSFSGCEIGKKRIREANFKKYGIEETLQLPHVKDAREKALEENKEEINEKRKAFWTEENIRLVNDHRTNTLIDRYGVDHNMKLDWVCEKIAESIRITCRNRYSVDNVMQLDWVREKVRETNINNKNWYVYDNLDEIHYYYTTVWNETRKHIKILFENWDGLDYYTRDKLILNEEFRKINPDINLSNNLFQPTIDHKISISYGFKNNVDFKIIGGIDNLVICGRQTNSAKGKLNSEDFIKLLKERLHDEI